MGDLAWTPTRFRWALLFLVLAATLNGLVFVRLAPQRVVEGTDAPQYLALARNLAEGRGFALSTEPPYDPTVYREPGYPLLAAVVLRASGFNLDALAVVQSLLLGLAAGLAAAVGARLVGPSAGLLGGVLFGLGPEMAHYARQMLSEVLFTVLLLASLGLALRAQASGRRRDHLAAGVALGLATLVRAIAGGLVPAVALACILAGRPARPGQALARGALLVAGAALVLAPWIARNADAVGRPTLTSRFGVNLVRRAPKAAEPPARVQEWLAASAWMMGYPLSALVVPPDRLRWGPGPEDSLLYDFHVSDSVRYLQRYDPVCRAAPDWEACASEVGLGFVRAYPVAYLAQSGFELVKLHFTPLPSAQGALRNVLVWLALLAAATLAVRRRLGRPHLLVLLTLGAYLGVSVLVDAQVRYLAPVLPLYTAFAAVPLAAALGGAWRRLRRSAGRRTAPGDTPVAHAG